MKNHNKESNACRRDIIPRAIDFDFSQHYGKYWYDNSPVKTYYGNMLGYYIPYGERFIITSVKHHRHAIRSTQLRKDVVNLLKQESYHAREHFKFIKYIIKPYFPIMRMTTRKFILFIFGKLMATPTIRLSISAAGEFFTSNMSEMFLTDPTLLHGMPPALQEFWRWHFIEEIEHRAVAFDVMQEAGCGYLMRAYGFLISYIAYVVALSHTYFILAKHDKKLFSPKFYWHSFKYLWIKPGIFRRTTLAYFKYLKPYFHPKQIKIDYLVDEWVAKSSIIKK